MRKLLNIFLIFTLIFNVSLLNISPSFAQGIKDVTKKTEKKKDKKNKPDNKSKCPDYDECDLEDDCSDSDECDLNEDDECESGTCKLTDKSKKKDKTEKPKKDKNSKKIEEDDDEEDEEESKNEPEIHNYDLVLDNIIAEAIYPSFILFAQMNKELSETPLFHFYIEDENAHVKVTVEENEFMEPCVSEHDMTEKDECIFSPWIKWKRNALLNADKPGFINFSAVLEVNGKVKNRTHKTITFRSVNEAILGFYEDGDKEENYTDFSPLLSCFVNEDHPRIDKVLNEIIDKDKKAKKITFFGYQGDSDKDVLNQMEWIWNYFAAKGTRYSDITGSSNSSEKINSQYIRFFEQVIDNNQANCIDGTCMLASFYKKIGLDVNIILVPGHAFLAVAGKDRDEEGLPLKLYYLETTMMGEKDQNFKSALKSGQQEFEEYGEKDAYIVNVESCRAAGIMPLGR